MSDFFFIIFDDLHTILLVLLGTHWAIQSEICNWRDKNEFRLFAQVDTA